MQQNPIPQKRNTNILEILIVIVIISAASIRLTQWLSPPSDPPLLSQTDDLILITQMDDPRLSDQFMQLLPTETYGGAIRVIGVYPTGGIDLPKNSISVVYEKDGWRMMQIDLLPETSKENIVAPFLVYPHDVATLSEKTQADYFNIKTFLDCLQPNTKDGIGSCRFTRMLVFEIEPGLIGRLAVDGEHVTDGELIMIARSMLDSIDDVRSN